MGLTSPALLILLAVLAAALLLTITLGWSKMAGRDLRSIAQRTLSLVTLQALVLAVIFVAVNRSGEFYSSWSDLFGLDKAAGAVIASTSGGSSQVQPLIVASRSPVRVPGSKAASGVLETVTFNGAISGVKVAGQVFVPTGCRAGSRPSHCSVIVEISDNLASANSGYGAAQLAGTAAQQIARSQLRPVIIVMVPASFSVWDQGCLDIPAQRIAGSTRVIPPIMAATFFTQDLPSIVETQYGASANSANWGLLGDSSGGYCALQLAMTSSWAFSAAVVPGGAYTQPPGLTAGAETRLLRQQDDLLWLLRNQPMQPVSVLFTGSGPSAASARSFEAAVRRPMSVSTLTASGGGSPVAPALDWLGGVLGSRRGLSSLAVG